LYVSARNVREFGELLISSTLRKTPLLAITILFVLTICYVLYLGVEVLGRTAEVFIVILLLLGVTGNFLVLVSGNWHPNNLQPFLEYGWKPIVTTAFRDILIFPFGELLVFTMLLPYLTQPESVKKVWLSAVISGSLVLSYTTSLNIAVLSIEEVERSTFPLLSTVGKVNLMEFLQRLDAIVVYTLLITVFFKAAIYLYGALIGIVDLFNLKNHQQILLPIGVILIFFSIVLSATFAEQTEEGILVHYIAIVLLIIIPLLMLLVSLIRNRFKKAKDEKGKSESSAT
jgi:spore germination protein KB